MLHLAQETVLAVFAAMFATVRCFQKCCRHFPVCSFSLATTVLQPEIGSFMIRDWEGFNSIARGGESNLNYPVKVERGIEVVTPLIAPAGQVLGRPIPPLYILHKAVRLSDGVIVPE